MKKLFCILLICFTFSCEKAVEYYFGINMQPDFLEDDFVPGLNIFGVIRTDSTDDINGSFVYIQKVIRAVGDSLSEIEIDSADVCIYRLEKGDATDTILFNQLNISDSSYRSYVPQTDFIPVQGQTYELKCSASGLPELGGITNIPFQPEITNLSVLHNKIEFDIIADTTAFMYKIYLLRGDEVFYSNILLPSSGAYTHFSFNGEASQASRIVIYSYDKNLAAYTANSNTEFNINNYRQYDNQVNNGYGVFGSVNYLKFDLNLK